MLGMFESTRCLAAAAAAPGRRQAAVQPPPSAAAAHSATARRIAAVAETNANSGSARERERKRPAGGDLEQQRQHAPMPPTSLNAAAPSPTAGGRPAAAAVDNSGSNTSQLPRKRPASTDAPQRRAAAAASQGSNRQRPSGGAGTTAGSASPAALPAPLTGASLTKCIKRCRDAAQLAALMAEHPDAFNARQVATAWKQLCKLRRVASSASGDFSLSPGDSEQLSDAAGDKATGQAAGAGTSAQQALFALSLRHLPRMDARQLCYTAWAAATLGAQPPAEWLRCWIDACTAALQAAEAPAGAAAGGAALSSSNPALDPPAAAPGTATAADAAQSFGPAASGSAPRSVQKASSAGFLPVGLSGAAFAVSAFAPLLQQHGMDGPEGPLRSRWAPAFLSACGRQAPAFRADEAASLLRSLEALQMAPLPQVR